MGDETSADVEEEVKHLSGVRTRDEARSGERSRVSASGTNAVVDLATPSPHAVLGVVLDLSRSVSVETHEDSLAHAYVDALTRLFPGRLFAMRLLAPETNALSTVYAIGRLCPKRREVVEVTKEAVARHDLDVELLAAAGATVVDRYVPFFEDGTHGFDVPLVDGPRFMGALSVDYYADTEIPQDDRPVIVQMVLQMATALRNTRLHRQSLYLQDYLSKLLDNANAPIMVMGKQGEVRFANRAFLSITQFSRDDLLGEDWLSFLPELERQRVLPIYIDALRGESSANLEVRLPRRDGSFAQVAVNTASILSADGEVDGVICIYRDVTEVRKLEGQILHAEKLATLGQMAAGVVHELNNPLTSISVYADYLLKKSEARGDEPRDVEKVRRILNSADRILRFTRDLVTYARPSTEPPTSSDIGGLLDQALALCEHLLDETGTRVVTAYAELPPVYGVKGQLLQVFVNLITNACHAMPMDAGVLRIETAPGDDGWIAVRVTDSGRGIPADILDRVFEPFFTTKGEGKGTGLGLSIVRNIVQQHRGTISVSSEVGRGTMFEIVLPCRPAG